jgi:DNA repair protein RecO (recombination protein O)
VLVANKTVLYAFNSIVSLMRIAFHEREPHNRLFPLLTQYLEQLIINFTLKDYINFELEILSESGHTLGLKVCGVTGTNENLYYVSPKSGNAITQHIGNPYADKLLRLPSFISNQNHSTISKLEQKQAFDLTEYFFNRYLLQNRTMPLARNMFVAHILDA